MLHRKFRTIPQSQEPCFNPLLSIKFDAIKQAVLNLTWSETPKTGFLALRPVMRGFQITFLYVSPLKHMG